MLILWRIIFVLAEKKRISSNIACNDASFRHQKIPGMFATFTQFCIEIIWKGNLYLNVQRCTHSMFFTISVHSQVKKYQEEKEKQSESKPTEDSSKAPPSNELSSVSSIFYMLLFDY